MRPGTCITDVAEPVDDGPTREWVSHCGCGKSWPLGRMIDVCVECVAGRCEHAKEGIDVEQMGMGL